MRWINTGDLVLDKREIGILVALLIVAFAVRIGFFAVPGYSVDLNTFGSWFNTAAQEGIRRFYEVTWCDYPPLNVYLFWVFGSLGQTFSLFGTPWIDYLIKLVPNLFDIATALLIFLFIKKRVDFKAAIFASILYAFNPAVLLNAAIWGQFDAIYTSLLVLSLMFALSSKPKLSIVAFALGVLTKPQSIALAPLIAFLIIKKQGWRKIFLPLLSGVATVFVVILPFEWANPITFLTDIYFGAYKGYAYTSVNAFNFWAIGGLWMPDTTLTFIMGWVLFGALSAFVLYVMHRRFDGSGEALALFSAFILFFGFFMLPTRIHERYLFPAISILVMMIPFIKKSKHIFGVLTATCFVNQAYVLYFLNSGLYIPTGDLVVLAISLINILTFFYSLLHLWDELQPNRTKDLHIGKVKQNMKIEV